MKTSYSGIDIGGANIKVYDGSSRICYFPMWQRWKELGDFLKGLGLEGRVGVVLTGELADSFSSKAEGVVYITNAVREAFDDVVFIDLDGNLKREIDNPENFAANNWVASVKFLSEEFADFIFADMGSTTTDLIPVKDGKILAGKTDFERLDRKELLYFGMLRTPSSFLVKRNCSSEFFSITGDAMLVLGLIDETAYSCETPDGRGKSSAECMQRLARQVCADLHEVGEDYVIGLAGEIRDEMVSRVAKAFEQKRNLYGIETAIGCGIGEVLLEEAAELAEMEYVSLRERYGEVSDIFPAFAMARLVELDDSG
ncbi:hydantoinase/oxoprolinase family protein [Geoglobus acetivorans]|uniref:H4MPT-linked C1 transfer pathway protein n=1 Tax=Geoglobus acetivorans TaxID=565033 RepID=A0ABZ3H412_GEOAI|nr:H4MPT-linked C1 transfer pathway protein [Geoglobus acetivorans]